MIIEAVSRTYFLLYIAVCVAFGLAYFLIFRRLAPQTRARWYPRSFLLALLVLGVPLAFAAIPDLVLLSAVGPYLWDEGQPPDGWIRHKNLIFEVHSLPNTACNPVSSIGILKPMQGVRVEDLVGTYKLTVVANPAATIDTMTVGYLWLEAADDAHRYVQQGRGGYSFPLFGASSVDLEGIGEADFLYRINSDDPDLPGVQAHFNERKGEVSLVFGAATTKRGTPWDTGVWFTVQKYDSAGFYGSWTGGGLRAGASGYYCAHRFDPRPAPEFDG